MSVHEIVPGLWLGDYSVSQSRTFHKQIGIGSVYNITKTIPFLKKSNQKHIRVPVDDNLKREEIVNLGNWGFETIVRIDKDIRNGKQVLVHCHAGRQRSAAIVAM